MNVLSLAYLPNIQWFTKLLEGAVIDVGEHYVKQSYRNRCEIAVPIGGRMPLTVSVAAGSQRLPMREVRIDYSKRWQHRHIHALRSAYGRAPFFEHYWPRVEAIVRRRHEFLYDLNRELLEAVSDMIRFDITISFSDSYIEDAEYDFRSAISPKRSAAGFVAEPYWQVFGGFEPNLSIVDLMFCEGPAAVEIIRRSMSAAPDL